LSQTSWDGRGSYAATAGEHDAKARRASYGVCYQTQAHATRKRVHAKAINAALGAQPRPEFAIAGPEHYARSH
jgi:hypothetical protein